nr:VTT domain-containing protein [Sansalvadorimonas sp. 2012CJ34-2]
MLAADKIIPPELAFVALLAGITSGDFLLYLFGHYAGSRPFMRKWRESKRASSIEHWLSSNLFITIFFVRFAPGLRLPCYLASGWLGVSVKSFLWAVFVAGVLWTGMVFGGLLWFGAPLWELSGMGNLFLLPLALLFLYLLQQVLRKYVNACLESNNDQ